MSGLASYLGTSPRSTRLERLGSRVLLGNSLSVCWILLSNQTLKLTGICGRGLLGVTSTTSPIKIEEHELKDRMCLGNAPSREKFNYCL